MGSSGKKKTTMAKLARENRLRERRLNKQAKKDARKQASPDRLDVREGSLQEGMTHSVPPDPSYDPTFASGTADEAVRPLGRVDREPSDPREKEAALLRLRDAPDEELAVFERKLQDDALEAGATEREMRDAQRNHPGHGA